MKPRLPAETSLPPLHVGPRHSECCLCPSELPLPNPWGSLFIQRSPFHFYSLEENMLQVFLKRWRTDKDYSIFPLLFFSSWLPWKQKMPLDFCPLFLFLSVAPTFHTSRRAWWPFPIKHWFLEQKNGCPISQFSLVQSLSHVWLFVTTWSAARQASLSITNSWSLLKFISLSLWCRPTVSSSVIPFSSHLQSFPASGSFQKSQFFASGGQSIGVLASASVLPMNIQDQFPLGLTGWISLQSKRLSRVLSNTTVQKHQLFSAQLSL